MAILTLKESADEAVRAFSTFSDDPPNLIPTGIFSIDRVVGGLFPGSAGILAAATGAGKSSVVLAAAMASKVCVGVISTEDTPDVFGSRAISWECGVDSLAIRRAGLSVADRGRVATAIAHLGERDRVKISYPIGGQLEEIIEAIEELASAGCRIVWLDYLQKIRGIRDDRRNEVSAAYTAVQRAAAKYGVALMVISQFSRQPDPSRPPQIWWLKESGDLENEARLILLASRNGPDLTLRVAKSTFGGEGTEATFRRDNSGCLREYDGFWEEPKKCAVVPVVNALDFKD